MDTFRRTEGISSAGVMWVQKSTELIILIRHNLCLAAAECWKQNIHGMELTFVGSGNNQGHDKFVDDRRCDDWLRLKRKTKTRWMNTNNESGLMLITFRCQCSVPAWQWHMARTGCPPGLAAALQCLVCDIWGRGRHASDTSRSPHQPQSAGARQLARLRQQNSRSSRAVDTAAARGPTNQPLKPRYPQSGGSECSVAGKLSLKDVLDGANYLMLRVQTVTISIILTLKF